ncbi:Scr1 family TA system antitoxin-like transcriptional regulator [Kibdelosporangium aridum]|uniref:Scr1 family TA system antitoxin-like transcriptional regulator n=1 Tax=Kibdelosporangium aridum TaxID=2030 RepID=UPI0005241954
MTLAELSQTLGWSISRTSRIENGLATVSDVELAHYMAYLGSTLAETLELVRFRQGRDRGYWLSPHGLRLEDSLNSLAFHEASAIATLHYQPLVVPGLLQTEDYARAMISRETWRTSDNIEECVQARMYRQRVVTRGRHEFYVHEQALRLQVGNPRLMQEQLLKLVLLADLQDVHVRIVPLAAGERSVFGNSFGLFEYDSGRPLLSLPNFATTVFIEDPEHVDPFVLLTPSIEQVALDTRQSQELLAAIALDYERAVDDQRT